MPVSLDKLSNHVLLQKPTPSNFFALLFGGGTLLLAAGAAPHET